MAEVKLEGVTKDFDGTRAVDDANLKVADGELVALLGASGCGKTTLLRLIAGFERVNAGRIAIGGQQVAGPDTHTSVEDRNVGIVFQSYALWPHMSVAENVGFPLKVARVPRSEARQRIERALDTVGLAGAGERQPGTLSGGQRQRVALARCLVMEPDVVLLDEPLANLDVHLRASMQETFHDFHRRSGQTMVYITHDQAEAMALADRVAVMDGGRLLQVARPDVLYHRPATPTVAGFIGASTVVPVFVRGGEMQETRQVDLLGVAVTVRAEPAAPHDGAAQVMLRPGDLVIHDAPSDDRLAVRVVRRIYAGGHLLLRLVHDSSGAAFTVPVAEDSQFGAGATAWLEILGGWLIPRDDPS
ncbi:ABC transporter ATP-binding protein [Rhodovibrio salinarum]|uniref:ABC transporter ATP-binding protein n=1 Tax=Rhodovibrio salinarum TaxID=1087 RepID=A0A934UZJ5_9PROT|nr:ABC transporter ATP-binding protein [Rhodovibrio salinarum]MBK1697257.1 ABC transporter ATP-binding protein [Rhodovibrio salinarum]